MFNVTLLIAAALLLLGLLITASFTRRTRAQRITRRARSAVDDAALFIAIILSLFPVSKGFAEAPTIRVALTVVPGQNSLSRTEARSVFRETQRMFSEGLGVRLLLISTKVKRAPGAISRLNIDNTQAELSYWSKRFWKTHVGGVIQVAILPPVVSWDGRSYFTGRAGGHCSLYSGFAYMTAPRVRDNGKSGLLLAPYVLAHELGHLLGAQHIDTPTIMHPGPLEYADSQGFLVFDIESHREIKECLSDWGK